MCDRNVEAFNNVYVVHYVLGMRDESFTINRPFSGLSLCHISFYHTRENLKKEVHVKESGSPIRKDHKISNRITNRKKSAIIKLAPAE